MDKLDIQESGERYIVTGLIVCKEFAERICPHWRDEWLIATENNIIARWAVDHFTKQKDVPGIHNVERIFFDHMGRGELTKAQGELIESVLTKINERFDAAGGRYDFAYQYDLAVKYFRKRDLELGIERAGDLLGTDDVEEATTALAISLKPVIENDPASHIRDAAADAIIAASIGNLDTARIAAFRAATVGSSTEKLPDPWGDPEPLPLDTSQLPPLLHSFVDVRARVIGSEPSAMAWSVIAACSASLPSTLRLQMKRNDPSFTVPPGIWLLLVGNPSSRKSPTLKVAFAPLFQIHAERIRKWEAAKREWDQEDKATRGPEPRLTQLITNNTTPEGIRDALAWQDRGIIAYCDEWSGHIGSMGRYSGGRDSGAADKAFWNILYEGGPYTSNRANRKGGERIAVPDLQGTVVGGVQPDILRRFNRNNELTADGMLQRSCPIWMGDPKLGEDVDTEAVSKHYERLIRRLVNVPGNRTLHLSPEAEAIRTSIEERLLHYEQIKDFGAGFTTAAGKLHGIWGRLALTLAHVMARGDERNGLTEISGEAARLAEWLVFDSLIPNLKLFYLQVLGGGSGVETTQAIAGFLLREQRARVTSTDIVRHVHAVHNMKTDHVRDAVSPLVSAEWLTPEGNDERRARTWDVNPVIYTQFAERAAQAQMRAAMARNAITASVGASRARNSDHSSGAMTFIAHADAKYKKGLLDKDSKDHISSQEEDPAKAVRARNKSHSNSRYSNFSFKDKILHNIYSQAPARTKPIPDERG